MPHNPFPDPAAVHPGEAEMLSAVLANLTDDLPKLVYADWLEERGDPRGVFLRAFTTAARNGDVLPEPRGFPMSWLDLNGVTAVLAARGHNLPLTPDQLLRDALPALTFLSEPADETDLPIGASKFGGEPDVPAGFEWPEYQGRPLSFLAQFNLSELAGSPACRELPREGLLSVFYSVGGDVYSNTDTGGWRILHIPNTGHFERQTPPEELNPDYRFSPVRLIFGETLMLPEIREVESGDHDDFYPENVSNTQLAHVLLGHTRWLQGGDWPDGVRQLFTIDTDDKPGWNWGDSGLLYFGISADDLKVGRFDRTVFEMQCC